MLALALALLPVRPGRLAAEAGRPTSGDASILSGRTNGNGTTVVAAAAGFPHVWALVLFAPSSGTSFGFRASALYGSPLMGFGAGPGGALSVPFRFHVIGVDQLDVSLTLEPAFALGQGALFGETGIYDDDFGYASYGTFGARLGWQATAAATIVLGAHGMVGYARVPKSPIGEHLVASTYVTAGIEGLLSRDFLLFAELDLGFGLAGSARFDDHLVTRGSFGVAYVP